MRYRSHLLLLIAGLLCFTVLAPCQDGPPQSGSPSAGGEASPAQAAGSPGSASSGQQTQPDTHPLTGAYLYTLGAALEGRSYLEPTFGVSEAAESNPAYRTNSQQTFAATTIPEAQISLVHISRTNEFEAGYVGGAFIYDSGAAPDATFDELILTDVMQFRRWQISLSDLFSYLPEAGFGFGGVGAFGGLGTGLPSGSGIGGGLVNPMYTQNQSILTSQFGAYNNTTIGEAAYSLTARTSVSVGGSYGTLQSGNKSAGFITGNQAMGFAGVQHRLTARDSLGVMYNYGTFHYVGLAESFQTQMASLDYGRKITGRLALQLYGGPELLSYRITPANSFTRIGASGTGALTYLRDRNTLGLFVSHYSTGGSGVFAGADTTMVSGSLDRQLTRRWTGMFYGGYARNSEIAAPGASSTGVYDSWFANASASRHIGRYVSFYLGYEYERQVSNSGPCTSAFCAGSIASQIIGAGFTFHPRPIGL